MLDLLIPLPFLVMAGLGQYHKDFDLVHIVLAEQVTVKSSSEVAIVDKASMVAIEMN
jgi:hypothetical protein